ncbi:MAG: ATP-binding protein [Myxococcales bacterium]|nr:ATP-binding protein [Myxococcales bacterium]
MVPDVVFINGSFGVGKTTVAMLLQAQLPGSRIYDPEWTGPWLRAVSRFVPLKGTGTDDFQDFPLWRVSVVAGVRASRVLARGPVLVPMTFYRLAYREQVAKGLQRAGLSMRSICLVASRASIRARLRKRGDDPDGKWLSRKIERCLAAHGDPRFGEPVDTERRTSEEVVEEIRRLLEL